MKEDIFKESFLKKGLLKVKVGYTYMFEQYVWMFSKYYIKQCIIKLKCVIIRRVMSKWRILFLLVSFKIIYIFLNYLFKIVEVLYFILLHIEFKYSIKSGLYC